MKRMVLWVIELGQHVMPHGFLHTYVHISDRRAFLDMCVVTWHTLNAKAA